MERWRSLSYRRRLIGYCLAYLSARQRPVCAACLKRFLLRHRVAYAAAVSELCPAGRGYSPTRKANETSCARSRAPTFVMARTACVLTVNGDTGIWAAISSLPKPLAMRMTTSHSLGVRAPKSRSNSLSIAGGGLAVM